MPVILPVKGISPGFGKNIYIAPNATIVGDVVIGDDCSVWFNAVIRGDVNSIRIGNKVNIQDGCIIHCTYQKAKTVIGNNVSIGHNAIVHGCTIQDNVLIGMGPLLWMERKSEAIPLLPPGPSFWRIPRWNRAPFTPAYPPANLRTSPRSLSTGK